MTLPAGVREDAHKRSIAWIRMLCAIMLLTIGLMLPATARAQSAAGPLPPFQEIDGNGVDLVGGAFTFAMQEGSIGNGEAALSLMRYWAAGSWADNWSGGLYYQTSGGVTTYYVNLGEISDSFTLSGSTFTSRKANGATLALTGTTYQYVSSSGVKIVFQTQSPSGYPLQGYSCPVTAVGSCYIPISIVKPNGMTYTFNWDIAEKCNGVQQPDCPSGGTGFFRFVGVGNTPGYSFTISYLTNVVGTGAAPQTNWYKRTGVAFADPAASCGATCPTQTYSTTGALTLTDGLGRVWRFTTGTGGLTGIKRPGSASADTTTIAYGANGVTNLTRDGVAWVYLRTPSGTTSTMKVTDPIGNFRTIISDLTKGRVTSVQDELTHTTSYAYDANARLQQVTAPEGNYTVYAYDARGNVNLVTQFAKAGSGLANIVTAASYPGTCTNPASCNKPDWTKDAKGYAASPSYQTDYLYDPTTGLPTSVTLPAPVTSGTRPQTRYSYSTVGGVVVLTGISACQTGSTCTGAADEVKTTIGYNSYLETTTVSKGSGDGVLTATSTLTYDPVGNLLTVDGPLPGTGDTTRYRYDVDREQIGAVGPNPGVSPLKPRALRNTYNADGQVTISERGTVTDQSDPAWAAFATLQQQNSTYDANARATQTTATAGGTTYALQEYSYDALGRLDCSATRMNALTGATAACTPTSGTASDRITKNAYDALSRLSSVTTGYAVAPRTFVAYGYTANGQTQTISDGNSNQTTYGYDGFDRLATTTLPTIYGSVCPTSPTDQELLGYDINSNVVSRKLRNCTTITYAYDTLDRLTGKTFPVSNANLNPTFTYDNLGRLKTATNTNSLYNTSVAFGYDALDRKVSEANGLNGTVLTETMQYDLAGRRTRLTWPDTLYVSYDYDLANDTLAIRESGAASGIGVLASFTYDDLGRRTALTRGNGTATGYGYDGVSRLTGLNEDLAGASWDQAQTYSYNPASQITQRTSSNDAYAWTGAVNGSTSYVPNVQNRYSTIGGVAPGYDPRGNLTVLGPLTFTYSSENELATVVGSFSHRYNYDALHRLVYDPGVGNRLLYDGDEAVAEYTSATALARRFVFGPGVDEPLVWYEGSGTTDRRWLHADERGSVTAISNAAGNALAIDAYDEYGVPKTSNIGRFQYTGQQWLADSGMYYYKYRMYVPSIGRFAQTDPIGYDNGPNWYNYVGSDPVNFTDSYGLDDDEIVVTGKRCGAACKDLRRILQNANFTVTYHHSGGGGGGGGGPQNNQPPICPPPPEDLKNSGKVSYKFVEGNVTAGGTSGDIYGEFNTTNGYSGTFHTSFDGLFIGWKGFGVAEGHGSSQSLATFSGKNFNLVGTLFTYSFSDNYDTGTDQHVGETDAASTPGLGGGATISNTTLLTIHCPG